MPSEDRKDRLAQAERQVREVLALIQEGQAQLDLFYKNMNERIAAAIESVRAVLIEVDPPSDDKPDGDA